MDRPYVVRLSVKLLYGAIVVNVMYSVRLALNPALLFDAIFQAIPIFMALFFTVKITQGKNWARITYLVLFIIAAIVAAPRILEFVTFYVTTTIKPNEVEPSFYEAIWYMILAPILQLLLQVVALYILFLKSESNDWFRKMKIISELEQDEEMKRRIEQETQWRSEWEKQKKSPRKSKNTQGNGKQTKGQSNFEPSIAQLKFAQDCLRELNKNNK